MADAAADGPRLKMDFDARILGRRLAYTYEFRELVPGGPAQLSLP